MLTGEQIVNLGIRLEDYELLSDAEKQVIEDVLNNIDAQDISQTLQQLYDADYDEIPVDYETFLTDDMYLGRATKHGTLIYDFWKKEGQKIFNLPEIVEVALSGAIGTGKTTNGVAMMAYHMYSTMCMKNPQEFFGMRPGSKISYAFLNNTLDSSYGVGYDTLQSFLMSSPWFLKHGTIVGRGDTERYVPGKGFEIIVGSRVQHTLGHNVIAALMDEVSFAPGQNAAYEKSKVMELYRNIRRRINSRFTVQGKNYGKLFLVSSKATESSFLEAYIADQVKKGYPIYVVDEPIWVVKPFMYSGKKFKVGVGNKYLPSRIVPDGSPEEVEAYCEGLKSQGMTIIDVPVEEKQAFDQDIDKALQDIAGIATSVVTKAFNSQKVLNATSEELRNPFTTEIVSLGMNDDLQLKDFFDRSLIPENIYGAPIFIHLDASVSGDRSGLAGTAIIGSRHSVIKSEEDDDEEKYVDELICQEVFHVGIQPPADSEISFEKTRQFIYWLKESVGLNIKHVSTDGFQSVDTRQILSTKGFDTGYTSLDRTPDGYDGLRSAIYDKRYILLGGAKLFEELTELERDNLSRKYDHPPYSSKDIADAVAGSHADAMAYKDEYLFFHPDDYDYEGLNSRVSEEEQLKNDLISSMTQGVQRFANPVEDTVDIFSATGFDEGAHPRVNVPDRKLSVEDIFDDISGSRYSDSNILLL